MTPTSLSDLLVIGKPGAEPAQAVFPGAFNPRHAGHLRMAAIGERLLAAPVHWELSIENVDKPELPETEIARRTAQFAAHERVWVTRAARFAQKALLFPAATFLVGADTILRLADSSYYGGDDFAMRAAWEEIAEHNCRFLVFGRVVQQRFVTLAELGIPSQLAALCREVSEAEFREDVSSSELRKQKEEFR